MDQIHLTQSLREVAVQLLHVGAGDTFVSVRSAIYYLVGRADTLKPRSGAECRAELIPKYDRFAPLSSFEQ